MPIAARKLACVDAAHVLAVDEEPAAAHLVEAEEQARDGRFARPARPHDGDRPAGRHGEGDVLEDGPARVVAEEDMVEDDLPASRLKRLRVGRILDLGPDLEEAEHRLHVDERLAHLAVDEAEEIERDVELDEVGVDQHEVADRHPPGDDPRSGHHHDDREPHRDDRRLADVQKRERHLALDRGALVAREGLFVAPRLVRLVAEILDRLVVEQAVDRLGIRLLVALVHPATVFRAPLGDGEGEGDVARDGDEGDEGEPEIEEHPQHAADEADLDEGRQDVEEHEAERELDPRRPPLDRAHHAAGAAVEMEAKRQAVEMHEGARAPPGGSRVRRPWRRPRP